MLHRHADRVACKTPRQVREAANLIGRDVAERQVDHDYLVTRLPLWRHVGGEPFLQLGTPRGFVLLFDLPKRPVVTLVNIVEVGSPAGIFRKPLAVLQDQAPELLDAELGYQELQARAGPHILLPRRANTREID